MKGYLLILLLGFGICTQFSFCAIIAERSLSSDYYFEGQQKILIQLFFKGEADIVVIEECIPPGWSVVNAPKQGYSL